MKKYILLYVLTFAFPATTLWGDLTDCRKEFALVDGKRIYPAVQYGNTRRTPHPATRTLSVNGNRIYFLCKTYLERADGGTRVRSIYAAAFNGDRAIPDWVAYRLDPARLRAYENSNSMKLKRSGSQFYMDQTLKEMGVRQAIPMSYSAANQIADENKKYAKGHLMPAGAAGYRPEAMDASFSFANAAPQHPTMNSGAWSRLERSLRKYVKNTGHALYIITGVYGTSFRNKTAANPEYKRHRIGPFPGYQPTIPACFYKVVHDANTGESWAYLMPNTGATRRKSYKRFIITVADLRKRMRKAHKDKTQAQKYYPHFSKLPGAGELPRRHGTMPDAIWYRGGIKRKPNLERYPLFREQNFPGC